MFSSVFNNESYLAQKRKKFSQGDNLESMKNADINNVHQSVSISKFVENIWITRFKYHLELMKTKAKKYGKVIVTFIKPCYAEFENYVSNNVLLILLLLLSLAVPFVAIIYSILLFKSIYRYLCLH